MAAHYVNNAEFLMAVIDYKQRLNTSKVDGTDPPRIPEYIGECILAIANRLSRRPNFSGYSYREDMVLDGIENCMQCMHSFDPAKSSNPFSYFTQVIWFAFLRRIAKEKKQSYIRGRLIQDMPFESFDTQGHDDDTDFRNAYAAFIQTNQNFDASYGVKKEKKASISNKQSLEGFIDGEETKHE
jgi:hypothetical protein